MLRFNSWWIVDFLQIRSTRGNPILFSVLWQRAHARRSRFICFPVFNFGFWPKKKKKGKKPQPSPEQKSPNKQSPTPTPQKKNQNNKPTCKKQNSNKSKTKCSCRPAGATTCSTSNKGVIFNIVGPSEVDLALRKFS